MGNWKLLGLLFFVVLLFVNNNNVRVFAQEEEEEVEEHVLTLDHSNFTQTVTAHDFIVVEFYAPWCGHCKKLAPEYEEAARVLSSNNPPLVLAKIDASDSENKDIAIKYEVQGFPTLKIFRKRGEEIQEYNGPREANGIISYLKKQSGPPSVEINTFDDVKNNIDEAKVVLVGIFSEFSGEEFDNFTNLAKKLRSEYDFYHTLDAKLIPRGESSLKKPTLRLLKPFDELFVDSQDFHLEALEKFVEKASEPIVTIYDKDPNNLPFVMKFFNSPNAKAMMVANFGDENLDALKSKYKEVATAYKGQGVAFLLSELETSQNIMQYFGVKADQVPFIIIQTKEGNKYLKANLKSDDISSWFKEYTDGKVKPFVKSEPIPEVNDEPVKVIVADSIKDMVLESEKNVLLEFYAPWCGHCKNLAPILDEVALSFKDDPEILIAKLDATENDFPRETFEVKGFPTMYFKSANGKIVPYEGDRTKEAIVEFIEKNRDKIVKSTSEASAPTKDEL